MKKSKSEETSDRLSGLPNSLIFKILGLLKTRDAVRTTVLSNRWKNLWTSIPCLYFEDDIDYDNADKLRDFVNRALIWWRGMRLLKFKIHFRHRVEKSLFSDIAMWLRFAKEKEVEELCLYLCNRQEPLPQYLYSCSSLKELCLKGCNFEIPRNRNVQWDQLKRLEIEGYGVSVTEHLIDQVLSGSPQLEVFILSIRESLRGMDMGEDESDKLIMQFRSTSLKELSIHKYSWSPHPSTPAELRICTPILETLKISGHPYTKCLLNVPSCTHVTLQFYSPNHYEDDLRDFVGDAFSQILPTIQHVEKVTLLDCNIKFLGAVKKKCTHPHFPNFKVLELRGCFEEIVDGLDMFPELKMLVIVFNQNYIYASQIRADHALRLVKFESNLPRSFQPQLRAVDITWKEGADSMFPFIEIMLKYARKLEKMVIRISAQSKSLFLVSQKLLRMQRSSPNCIVDIIDPRNVT